MPVGCVALGADVRPGRPVVRQRRVSVSTMTLCAGGVPSSLLRRAQGGAVGHTPALRSECSAWRARLLLVSWQKTSRRLRRDGQLRMTGSGRRDGTLSCQACRRDFLNERHTISTKAAFTGSGVSSFPTSISSYHPLPTPTAAAGSLPRSGLPSGVRSRHACRQASRKRRSLSSVPGTGLSTS